MNTRDCSGQKYPWRSANIATKKTSWRKTESKILRPVKDSEYSYADALADKHSAEKRSTDTWSHPSSDIHRYFVETRTRGAQNRCINISISELSSKSVAHTCGRHWDSIFCSLSKHISPSFTDCDVSRPLLVHMLLRIFFSFFVRNIICALRGGGRG